MFFFLNRMARLAFFGLLIGAGVLAWLHRARFQPIVDLVDIGIHYPADRKKIIAEVTGDVTKVTAGDSFEIKGAPALTSVRLAGLEIPDPRKAKDNFTRSLISQSKTNLGHLILSNQVTIKVLHTNQFRVGAGIVLLNGTNINAQVVRSGLGWVNSTYAEGLPTRERKILERAEQQAVNERKGMWGKN